MPRKKKSADALFTAVVQGDLAAVQALASEGLDLLQPFDWGYVMHRAMYANNPAMVEGLVKLGVPVGQRDEAGRTFFFDGLHRDRSRSLLALLDCGADIDQVEPINGRTALMLLARELASDNAQQAEWALELTRELIRRGADRTIRDRYGFDAAAHAVYWRCRSEYVSILEEEKSAGEVDATLRTFEFIRAAGRGDLDQLSELCGLQSDLNAKDVFGKSALFEAASSGHLSVVTFLLSRGALVDLRNASNDMTALMVAAGNRRVDVIQALLAAGADINARCSDGVLVTGYAGSTAVRKLLVAEAWKSRTTG